MILILIAGKEVNDIVRTNSHLYTFTNEISAEKNPLSQLLFSDFSVPTVSVSSYLACVFGLNMHIHCVSIKNNPFDFWS